MCHEENYVLNYYWGIKCWQFCLKVANHQSLFPANIILYGK